jgi:hypothetical protein
LNGVREHHYNRGQKATLENLMTFRNFKVQPVVIAGVPGFQVQAIWRACSDSLWETMAHAAVFPTRERAERMMARIQAKPWWEWSGKGCWGVPVGRGLSNLDYIQEHVAVYCPL